MSSGICFHPSDVKLTSENYMSWKQGINNHCLEHDLLPYLLGHVCEPSDYEQKIEWLNSNNIAYGLICITISEDILHHIEHIECPFIAWTIIRQLYGDIDSSSESDDSLDSQASMDDTKIFGAPSCLDTSFLDDQFADNPFAPVVSSEFRVASLKASNDYLQQDHLCLLDSVPWDQFLSDISFLFVESLISDLDDTIDCLHLLFDGGDSLSIIVREHSDSLSHFLHYHSSQFDMSMDSLALNLKEIYLSSKEIPNIFAEPFILIPLCISAEWEFSSLITPGFYLPKGRGVISCKGTYYSIRYATFCISILSLLCEGTYGPHLFISTFCETSE